MQPDAGFSALDFMRSFTGPPRRRELAELIVASAQRVAMADFVELLLPNDLGEFRIAAVTGSLAQDRQGHLLPRAGSAVRAPTHAVTLRDPERDPALDQESLVSALALPVPLGSNATGILVVGSRSPRTFPRGEVRRLERVAEQATLALIHIRGLARERAAQANAEVASVTSALLEAAAGPETILLRVVAVAAQLSDATRCSIITYDGDQARIQYLWHDGVWEQPNTPVPLETSVAGWVLRHRSTYRASHPTGDTAFAWQLATPPKSILAVPVFSRHGSIRAVLILTDRRDSGSFSVSQQHLVQGMAQIADVAIERAELMAELAHSEERYRDLFENANDLITICDFDGRLISANRACERLTGYSHEELLARNLQDLVIPRHRRRVLENIARLRTGEQVAPYELDIIAKDGSVISVEFATRLLSEDGTLVALQSIGRDIRDRKALEAQLVHQAFNDPLTGLANRAPLIDRLSQALRTAKRRRTCVTVLFLDLDDFKSINDSLGHNAGDDVLVQVAGRLSTALRGGDTLARWGGDEFIILLGEPLDASDAIPFAERLIELLQAPLLLSGHQVRMGTSIGIASSGRDGQPWQAEALLHAADCALYAAKNAGKGRVVMYDEAVHGPAATPEASAQPADHGALPASNQQRHRRQSP